MNIGSVVGVDGIELETFITEKKAHWLCYTFALIVATDYRNKKEVATRHSPDSFKRTGSYRNMILEVRKKKGIYTFTIRGSLPKFYHGNNKCDFFGYELLEVIQILAQTFKIDTTTLRVLNIEIGVNILIWFEIYKYLKLNLLYHKKSEFIPKKEKSKFGFYCFHDNYFIKMYGKDNDLLKYEIKYTSTVDLQKKYNIEFLSDVNPDNINLLIVNTCVEFGNIIMRDGLNITNKNKRPAGMTQQEADKLYMISSKCYLSDYKEDLSEADAKEKNSLRILHWRLLNQCKELIKKFGNGDHAKLHSLIIDKAEEAINSWERPEGDVTKSPINKKTKTLHH